MTKSMESNGSGDHLSHVAPLSFGCPPSQVVAEEESGGNNIALAWGLSLMAGLSTILGAGLVGFMKPNQHRLMSFLNAFTAGIMLQGSVAGLGNEAAVLLADNSFNQTTAFWTIFMMFFLGCAVCAGLEVCFYIAFCLENFFAFQG